MTAAPCSVPPECRFDTSQCGPAFTPTATVVETSTPAFTSTPTPRPPAETACSSRATRARECPADCTIQPCTATDSTATYTVSFQPPQGQDASSTTVLVGYRSNILNIPGSGLGSCQGGSNDGHTCTKNADCPDGQCAIPKSHVKNTPPNSIVAVNDLDYALRVVVARSPLPTGRLFTVDFDTCAGAAAPTPSDVSCIVDGCSSSFGPLDGCTCTVSGP